MEEAAKVWLGQGVLGVLAVVLLLALREVFKLYVDSQEKRIAEAVENRTAIERNTTALTALTDVIKGTRS